MVDAVRVDAAADSILLVFDMDSTLLANEGVVEVAPAELRPRMAELTASCLRGAVDFKESLRLRVALLEGLPLDHVAAVARAGCTLNAGVKEFFDGLKERGYRVRLFIISGGLEAYARRAVELLEGRCSGYFCNRLEAVDGRLSGRLSGPIIGRPEKAALLSGLRQEGETVIAFGDGANDIDMLAEADVGVAYRAGRAVKEALLERGVRNVLDEAGFDHVLSCLPPINATRRMH